MHSQPAFKRDRVLDRLNEKWGEEDERKTFFDLTAKRGEHGGLSLIPLLVKYAALARLHKAGEGGEVMGWDANAEPEHLRRARPGDQARLVKRR